MVGIPAGRPDCCLWTDRPADWSGRGGDGTVQPAPAVLDRYPPGTLFKVLEEPENRAVFRAESSEPTPLAE